MVYLKNKLQSFLTDTTEKAEDGVTLKYKHEDMMNMLKTSRTCQICLLMSHEISTG